MYSKAVGTVEGFIEWTVGIFDDSQKAIKSITKKYNDLLEKSFKLAETVTNYDGSDESLIATLNKKSSAYQKFIAACTALETELGLLNTYFDSMLENYTTYSITDAHEETVTTNNALLKGTNENDTLNIQSRDVKVYGGEGDDDFIASGQNITLIGEQGKDHFLLRDVTNKNYVDAGADDDTILSYGNNNTINGGSGNDSILVSVYEGFGSKNEIRGGDDDDNISITAVIENTVLGEAGNDFIHISEEANNNTILGGTGNDTITIDDADRNFIGYSIGDGSDTVFGFDSNDTLYIAEGDFSKSTIDSDVLVIVGGGSILLKDVAGKDSNVIKPLTFDDLFKGMQRNKVIFGTQQDDTINNTVSDATIDAGDGNDSILNWYGGDSTMIDTGDGNDNINNYGHSVKIDMDVGNDSVLNYGDTVSIAGGTGNDSVHNYGYSVTIDASDGNDSINNNNSSVTINGGTGDDFIINEEGANTTINGSAGDDTIYNYASSVTINGGDDNDSICNEGDSVTIDAGDGNDSIHNENSNNVSIVSGADNDYISNFHGNNVTINSGTGSDSIYNSGDSVFFSTGMLINTGEDDDYIHNDYSRNTTINSGTGNDFIRIYDNFATQSNISINAGDGSDTIENNSSYATVDGGEGNDSISNYASNVTINGGKDDDTIHAGSVNNLITYNLGDGNDIINGLNTTSTLSISGSSYSSKKSGSDIIVTVGEGSIILEGAAYLTTVNIIGTEAESDDTIDDDTTVDDAVDDTADDAVDDTADDTADDTIDDTADDSLDDTADDSTDDTADDSTDDTADDSTDDVIDNKLKETEFIIKDYKKFVDASKRTKPIRIIGSSLDNSIVGGKGNDTLDGTSGDDTLTGGKGSDLFIFNGGKDFITDYEKKDKINVGGLSYTAFAVNGDDVIFNFGDDNSLTIENGAGKAINMNSTVNAYTVNGVLDKKKKSIKLFATTAKFTADSKVMTIDGSATGAIEIIGNKKKNYIIAGASGATLNGGKGKDTLVGGAGADLFIYENRTGKDVIEGFSAGDSISLDSNVTIKDAKTKSGDTVLKFKGGGLTVKDTTEFKLGDTLYSGGVFIADDTAKVYGSFKDKVDLSTYSVANFDGSQDRKKLTITGTDSANSLIGGKGKDNLIGGAGNDTLWGGKGNDTLTGGDGADTFIYQAGQGKDVIADYAAGDLLQILNKKGDAGDFNKANFKDDTLTLSIKGGGKVVLSGVDNSTDFNINGDSYYISDNTLTK